MLEHPECARDAKSHILSVCRLGADKSDALVFFGATGDLAFRKIFPALHAMARRHKLDVPVVGVARSGWDLARFVEHARASIEQHGQPDDAAFEALAAKLRYVDGDYNDQATFARLKAELGGVERPAHYLAIPPSMFAVVVKHLAEAGSLEHGRIIVEKPFGRDLASARALNETLHGFVRRKARSSASITISGKRPSRTCSIFDSPTRCSNRSGIATTSRTFRSRWPNRSASTAAASSTKRPA